jgi:hypothetical protein
MPSTVSFTGSPFNLVSAEVRIPTVVRIKFTFAPVASLPTGATDALNPFNYTFSGPGSAAVNFVQPVVGNPETFDLNLISAIAPGSWTLTALNIQTSSGASLFDNQVSFFAGNTGNSTSLTSGLEDEGDAEKVIRKHLLPTLAGPNWDALIDALSQGDSLNWAASRSTFNQLFISTATGTYLDRLARSFGIDTPSIGIEEELLRQLVIAVKTEKITHQAFYKILEIFYGGDSVFAKATSVSGPFNLQDNDSLVVLFDNKNEVRVVFRSEAFTTIGSATSVEVANVITRAIRDSQIDGWASAFVDPVTGESKVAIYTGTRGLSGRVAITGGSSQQQLRFGTEKVVYTGTVTSVLGYNWSYNVLGPSSTRVTLTANSPIVNLLAVESGDYVVIGHNVGSIVSGSYAITDVAYSVAGISVTQSFTVSANLGFTGSVLQNTNNDYRFFSATQFTTLNGDRTVSVTQAAEVVEISVPATTIAIDRTEQTGAFLNSENTEIEARYVRSESGLALYPLTPLSPVPAVGTLIELTGARTVPVLPEISAGTPGTHPAIGEASAGHGTLFSTLQTPPSLNTEEAVTVKLNDGSVMTIGGKRTVSSVVSYSSACNRLRPETSTTINDIAIEADGATRVRYSWLSTSSMAAVRHLHAASVMADGRVMVTGGVSTVNGPPLFTVEIYDPRTNTWSAGPRMRAVHAGHTQTTLPSGRILVVGGVVDAVGTASNAAEVFDPATLVWTPFTMPSPRTNHTATLLDDGNVLIAGGQALSTGYVDRSVDTLAFWRCDSFTSPLVGGGGAYDLPITGAARTVAPGRVLNALAFNGDFAAGSPDVPSADLLINGNWTIQFWILDFSAVSSTTDAIVAYTAGGGGDANNRLIEIGANSGSQAVYWRYDKAGGAFETAEAQPVGNTVHVAVRRKIDASNITIDIFLDGRLRDTFVVPISEIPVGGTNSAWNICRDPKAVTGFSGLIDEIRVVKRALTDYEIQDDYLRTKGLAVQVDFPSGRVLSDSLIFDSVNFGFKETGRLATPRAFHEAIKLPDGRVAVVGGAGYGTYLPPQDDVNTGYWPSSALLTTEIYDPKTEKWHPSITLPTTAVKPVVGLGTKIIFAGGSGPVGTVPYNGTAASSQTRGHWTIPVDLSRVETGYVNSSAFDRIIPVNSKFALCHGGVSGGNTLTVGVLRVQGLDSLSASKINTVHKIKTALASKLTIDTPDAQFFAASKTVNNVKFRYLTAPVGDGPFSTDTKQPFTVQSATTLTAPLIKGQSYNQIEVASNINFPDSEGYLVFGYGTEKQSVAVGFYEKIGTTLLQLDFDYESQFDYPIGASVSLCTREPWNPEIMASGNSYSTASQLGLVEAQKKIIEASAAGFKVDFNVKYPGDRGLGGGGFPTEGDGKTSDVTKLWSK